MASRGVMVVAEEKLSLVVIYCHNADLKPALFVPTRP